jgi:hypothetical protein
VAYRRVKAESGLAGVARAHANGLFRVAKCGFHPMDACRIAETDGYDPTIIFAIEQGTAERGAVAPRSGPVLHGRAL